MLYDDDDKERMQNRIRDLELALGQSDDGLVATFRLTPVLNNLLGLILSVPVATPEMIRQRLEIAHDAKVAKHRLKKALAEFGIHIKSRRSVGYWLEDEDKAVIRGMVAAKLRNHNVDVTPRVIVENNNEPPDEAVSNVAP